MSHRSIRLTFGGAVLAVGAMLGGCGCSPAPPAGGQPSTSCSKIDKPTLAQIFPNGNYDEQKCKRYFGDGYAG